MNTPRGWDELAEEWDVNRRIPSATMAFFTAYAKGDVLDAGCGNGRNAREMAKTADCVVALDSSTRMLEKAEKNLGGVRNAKIVHASMQKIPLPDKIMDAVICLAAFHHLAPKDQPKAVAEFFRVLKPNGAVCLTIWNRRQARFRNKPKEINVPWGGKPRYYYFFDEKELLDVLQKAGFKIENIFYEKDGKKADADIAANFCVVAYRPSDDRAFFKPPSR